jgi:hypothetical protein
MHAGRGHILRGINSQDGLKLYHGQAQGQTVTIGIICDGCSEGKNSEVGAKLAAEFLVREALYWFDLKIQTDLIPHLLYKELLQFMKNLVEQHKFVGQKDRVSYIKDTMLFTVVGFILTESAGVVFYAGDGTIVLDDAIWLIDAENRPMYPAYHLVDRQSLDKNAAELPMTFEVLSFDSTSFSRLAIGSDAWHQRPDLLAEIWGHTNPSGLQRQLNIWDQARTFADDVSVIAVELLRSSDQPEANNDPSDYPRE